MRWQTGSRGTFARGAEEHIGFGRWRVAGDVGQARPRTGLGSGICHEAQSWVARGVAPRRRRPPLLLGAFGIVARTKERTRHGSRALPPSVLGSHHPRPRARSTTLVYLGGMYLGTSRRAMYSVEYLLVQSYVRCGIGTWAIGAMIFFVSLLLSPRRRRLRWSCPILHTSTVGLRGRGVPRVTLTD